MHTPNDPEKYLNRNFYGDYSVSGVPFLDAGCTLYGTNMIIYGHDMSGGTMFAPLLNYMTKSYAQNHAKAPICSTTSRTRRIRRTSTKR